MKQFLSFLRKEFHHVFRDRKTLLLLFGMPIVQIVLFGFALTNEIKNSRIVICDYSRDEITQRITEKIAASKNFEIKQLVLGHREIENAFKSGDIKLAIIFPSAFQSDLESGKKVQVQIIADASDPNTATTLTGYATNIIRGFQQEMQPLLQPPMNISTTARMVYNPDLKGATNFVPGVMALVLMLICVLMTSASIVREKENGTMEVLLVSPMNPLMVIISKAIPYLILSVVNLIIILLLSIYLLGLPVKGNIFLLFGESTLLIITALSLGLLISNSTSSQQTAMMISILGLLLPTVMFTGFMFPLENMPKPLQLISNLVPSKWYYTIVKNIMIKGLGFSHVWKETLILAGMTVFLLFVSLKKFKIRLS